MLGAGLESAANASVDLAPPLSGNDARRSDLAGRESSALSVLQSPHRHHANGARWRRRAAAESPVPAVLIQPIARVARDIGA